MGRLLEMKYGVEYGVISLFGIWGKRWGCEFAFLL